jgi:hypothetical protein
MGLRAIISMPNTAFPLMTFVRPADTIFLWPRGWHGSMIITSALSRVYTSVSDFMGHDLNGDGIWVERQVGRSRQCDFRS